MKKPLRQGFLGSDGGFRHRIVNRLRGQLDAKTLESRGLQIGHNVYIGRATTLDTGWPWLISIGDDVTISSRVEVLAHDASMKRHVGHTLVARVTIGNRVYIGANVVILPGVTIGDDAIIGAGSLVRHDVPSRAVAVGNPARVVGTIDESVARHRELLESRPVFDAGWTWRGGITPQRMAEMRRMLEDGPGYV